MAYKISLKPHVKGGLFPLNWIRARSTMLSVFDCINESGSASRSARRTVQITAKLFFYTRFVGHFIRNLKWNLSCCSHGFTNADKKVSWNSALHKVFLFEGTILYGTMTHLNVSTCQPGSYRHVLHVSERSRKRRALRRDCEEWINAE